jgi:hypothetical protein
MKIPLSVYILPSLVPSIWIEEFSINLHSPERLNQSLFLPSFWVMRKGYDRYWGHEKSAVLLAKIRLLRYSVT